MICLILWIPVAVVVVAEGLEGVVAHPASSTASTVMLAKRLDAILRIFPCLSICTSFIPFTDDHSFIGAGRIGATYSVVINSISGISQDIFKNHSRLGQDSVPKAQSKREAGTLALLCFQKRQKNLTTTLLTGIILAI